MTSIGETLRHERQRRNLDLDEVSRELKISSRLLDAIETERFDRLPGGVFTRSFVRQYARLLSLDEEEIVGQLDRHLEPAPEMPHNARAQPPAGVLHLPRVTGLLAASETRGGRSSMLPSLAVVVLVMLICSGVYALWQRKGRPVVQAGNPPAAGSQAVSAPVPPAQSPVQPAAQSAQPPVSQPAEHPAQITPPPVAPAAAENAPPAAEAPAVEPPAAATPALAPHGDAPVRIEIAADEPVWMLARADGKFSFSGTLEAGRSRTVEANTMIELRLGNAGGVSVSLNGKPIGAVGPKGQVRTVQFTSGGFQIVAVPKSPAPDFF